MENKYLTRDQMVNIDYCLLVESMVSIVGLMKAREIIKEYRNMLTYDKVRENVRRKKLDKYGRRDFYGLDERIEGNRGSCE